MVAKTNGFRTETEGSKSRDQMTPTLFRSLLLKGNREGRLNRVWEETFIVVVNMKQPSTPILRERSRQREELKF